MGADHISPNEALQALERFVVDNDDLLALEERIGRFNIFDALRVARVEIRHSNFLAWLLDPAGSHGQGALFLKAVMMDLLAQAPAELRPASPVELDGVDLRGVDIRREWRNIDILITCEEPSFAVAIENKVGAGAYNPFQKYEQAVREAYPEHGRMFVLLTLEGDEPPADNWVPYSYADIHRVLARVRNTNAPSIGEDVLAFLDHYLRLIGSRFMDDPKIDELCQRIFKNHRQALELIFERVGSPGAGLVGDITEVINNDERWHLVNRTSRNVTLVPVAWRGLFPPIGVRGKFDASIWVVLSFHIGAKRCRFGGSVWPTSDETLRAAVIERLARDKKEFGFRLLLKGEAMGKKWTQLGKEPVAAWSEDEEPDPERVLPAVRKKLDEVAKRLEKVPEALRPILEGQVART